MSLSRAKELLEALQPEAGKLWMDIGERLLVGQERYGGFKFSEYDLEQMAREEIEDFIVYIVAKMYLREKE
jgi:hypothetical protein